MSRPAARSRKLRGSSARGLVYISTDSVFDGTRGYYSETDEPRPLNVYARSKLAGERAVLAELPDALIVRTVLYGWNRRPKHSLAEWMLFALESGSEVQGFDDAGILADPGKRSGQPVARACGAAGTGVCHVAASEACTKFEFAVPSRRRLDSTRRRSGGRRCDR